MTVEELISTYVAAWNEESPEAWRKAFATCWAEDAKYTDPDFDVTGLDGITGLAKYSEEKAPGRKFSVYTQPEYHHHVGRYNWQVTFSDGTTKTGFDYFEFNDENKITRIVSFF